MRITKYVHSCLLIEEASQTVLVDPGIYSTSSPTLKPSRLPPVGHVFITHIHADHLDIDWLKKSLAAFGNPPVIGNPSVVEELGKAEVQATTELPEFAVKHEWPHEQLPFGWNAPPNWGFTFFGQVTHPGDSLRFDEAAEALALPMQAPFASLKQAMDAAEAIKPKTIIPIHDWHWRDEAKQSFYAMSKQALVKQGMEFIEAEDGVSFEL